MGLLSSSEIANMRMANQRISKHDFKTPAEIVGWLGAVQAQDYHGSKWSVGLRLKSSTDKIIENAINNKSIIRTWAQRGTLHFVVPEDIYWITDLVAPKIIKSIASRYKQMELDEKLLQKSNKILLKAVIGNKAVTRKELKDILNKNKIPTNELRFNFILQRAVYDKFIVLGPRKDKEFTFVALEEWTPKTKSITRGEAIGRFAEKFFKSHGPATIHDFSWWSGLTLTECRAGLEVISLKLIKESVNNQDYWMDSKMVGQETKPGTIYLLPGFDEYLLGYKDRSGMIADEHVKHVFAAGNAIFKNTIVIDGKVAGTWRRTIKKNEVIIEPYFFVAMKKSYQRIFEEEVERYAAFLGLKAVIS